MVAPMAKTPVLLGLVAAALCAGCGGNSGMSPGVYCESPWRFEGTNIILVDLEAGQGSEDHARDMTRALGKALQGKRLFHVDALDRSDPALRDLVLDKRTDLTLEEKRAMWEQLQADGILFGSVTQYNVHPRMEVGLYLRLYDLKRGVLIWALDHTWDTTDKLTEEQMKTFFEEEMRDDYPPAGWRLVRMSPLTFQKFIAHEIVATLPPPTEAGD